MNTLESPLKTMDPLPSEKISLQIHDIWLEFSESSQILFQTRSENKSMYKIVENVTKTLWSKGDVSSAT